MGTAQAHVGDVESVGIRCFERVDDVFGSRVADLTWKHVVIAEQRSRCDTGHVVRRDAVDGRGRILVARGRA